MSTPPAGRLARLDAAATALADPSLADEVLLARIVGVDSGPVAAVQALAEGRYDLAIVDAGLPEGSAALVAGAARRAAGAPVVCVVSGSSLDEMRRAVPNADMYVEKVRVPDQLVELVRLARSGRG